MANTVERFDATVENYFKYRPSYPAKIYAYLSQHCGLTPNKIIADIGSGTGFLTKLFLAQGNTVYGVEPNRSMREVAEDYLAEFAKFHSVNGLAEASTLDNESVDWVTVGTAFHWFDVEKTKTEFKRILKSPGMVLLTWNVRDKSHSPLVNDYETLLLEYAKDYKQSRVQEFEQTAVADFFSPYQIQTAAFVNKQYFDWQGLKGRLLSTSYSLREIDPRYNDMLDDLQKIFLRYQINDRVEFLYETKLYYGRLK